jgi:hypothetical protein
MTEPNEELTDELILSYTVEDKEKIGEKTNTMKIFSLLSILMEHVENLKKELSGKSKKEAVLIVGEWIVQREFPEYLSYYKEFADDIIEVFIDNFYLLIKNKNITKCCF